MYISYKAIIYYYSRFADLKYGRKCLAINKSFGNWQVSALNGWAIKTPCKRRSVRRKRARREKKRFAKRLHLSLLSAGAAAIVKDNAVSSCVRVRCTNALHCIKSNSAIGRARRGRPSVSPCMLVRRRQRDCKCVVWCMVWQATIPLLKAYTQLRADAHCTRVKRVLQDKRARASAPLTVIRLNVRERDVRRRTTNINWSVHYGEHSDDITYHSQLIAVHR